MTVYRWVEHTAEVELWIEAPSEEEVFREAVSGIAEVLGDPGGEFAEHVIELEGDERARLLADLLEELVFLSETEQFVPERVVSLALAPSGLRAVVAGRRGRPFHLVKAVTYHDLEVERQNGGWRARVVLDV